MFAGFCFCLHKFYGHLNSMFFLLFWFVPHLFDHLLSCQAFFILSVFWGQLFACFVGLGGFSFLLVGVVFHSREESFLYGLIWNAVCHSESVLEWSLIWSLISRDKTSLSTLNNRDLQMLNFVRSRSQARATRPTTMGSKILSFFFSPLGLNLGTYSIIACLEILLHLILTSKSNAEKLLWVASEC